MIAKKFVLFLQLSVLTQFFAACELSGKISPPQNKEHSLAHSESNGWIWLFHGSDKDMENWVILPQRGREEDAQPLPITGSWEITGDTLIHNPSGGYLWSRDIFENFILELEVNISPGGNSGVYFWGQVNDHTNRGLEIQILDSAGEETPTTHSFGALYDALAPAKNTARPAGQWQLIRIKVDSPWITVELNHERVLRANMDMWDTAGKNPDGTDNKFDTALGRLRRKGHIGLQDHNDMISFRNIRIMKLPLD